MASEEDVGGRRRRLRRSTETTWAPSSTKMLGDKRRMDFYNAIIATPSPRAPRRPRFLTWGRELEF